MTTYTISTDAVMTTVRADSEDAAARKFAAREPMFAGCRTAADLAERAEQAGGWAKVIES